MSQMWYVLAAIHGYSILGADRISGAAPVKPGSGRFLLR